MKNRIVLFLGVLPVFVFGGLYIVWRNLNEKINSPEFKGKLESELSRILVGTFELSSFQGHLSLRPWVELNDIRFVTDQEDLSVEAQELRLTVRLLPLLKRVLVFSDILIIKPSIRLRQRSDGPSPLFRKFQKESSPGMEGFQIHFNQLSVQQGQLHWVDERYPQGGSFEINVDLKVEQQGEGGSTVNLVGHLTGYSEGVQFRLKGKADRENNLNFTAEKVPFALLKTFWSGGTLVSGTFNVEGFLSGDTDKRQWEIQGHTNDIKLTPNAQNLPLRVEWSMASGSPISVRSIWTSTASHVTATAVLPIQKERPIQLTLVGDRLDLGEFSGLFSELPSLSSSSKSGIPWTLQAKAEVGQISGKRWMAHSVRVRATASPTSFSLSELSFACLGATVTARSEGRQNKVDLRWEVSAQTEIKQLDLSGLEEVFPGIGFRRGRGEATGQWQWRGPHTAGDSLLFSPFSKWDFQVQVSSADWKGAPIDHMIARSNWGDSIFSVSELSLHSDEGVVELLGQVKGLAQNEPGTFFLSGKMREMETKEWMAALSTSAYLLHGRFSGEVEVSGPWRPWAPAEWNGRFSILGRNGEFRTAPTVLSVFQSLKIGSLLHSFEGKKETGLPFDLITATATLQPGRVLVEEPLFIKNPSLQLAYTGWTDMRLENGKGTLLFNFLQGTSDLIKKTPLISSLILSPDGELIPLVVDVLFENGESKVTPRSVKTLTGPLVGVVKNVFRTPMKFFKK